jgi:glycosyltransferase involved in cell wall biosynthesis
MKVVIVDGDVSYPATSGKRLRTLNLMLRAAGRHQITYVGRCAPDSEEARTAPAFLRRHGIEPVLVHHPVPQKSGPAFYARLAANVLSPLPYSVRSHHSDQVRQALRAYAADHAVELWQFEWAPYLDLLDPDIPGARLVVAHNVDTLIWRRYYENARGALKRAFLKQQWHKFERFERQAFRRAGRVVAVSAEDARIIHQEFGQPAVDVVDNGIDRAYFEQAPAGLRRDSRRILFLGALDWRPNLDAIDRLLDPIFPRVRAQEPGARLLVVGRNPPPALAERVRGLAGVELHANVADVRPFLVESGVMAVPLRIGGGSRLKILEALACGLPVVSTRVGAEGLCLTPGADYVRAEEDEMADALVRAIREPAAATALAEHGRRIVLETYDWDVLARKLEASWDQCVAGAGAVAELGHR